MNTDEEMRELLAPHRVAAPADLGARIMQSLASAPATSAWRDGRAFWPSSPRLWVGPSLAGAAAMLMFLLVFFALSGGNRDRAHVTFELHAPSANRVELLGSFNEWRRGQIVLAGPDASGYWTAELELPAGRHEYIFLVDGRQLVTDPTAETVRADGFGNRNAVIEVVTDERS